MIFALVVSMMSECAFYYRGELRYALPPYNLKVYSTIVESIRALNYSVIH